MSDLISLEEAELEDLALEVVLGDGLFTLSAQFGSQVVYLPCRWPSVAQEKQIERLTLAHCNGVPRDQIAEYDYLLALGCAICEVIADPERLPSWLPADERGRPNPSGVKFGALLRNIASAWERKKRRVENWFLANDGLNLRRITTQLHDLKLRDAVARHLATHPFDPKVTELSTAQMHVFLELRHPADPKKEEDDLLKRDAELLDDEELYRTGVQQEEEETPDDEVDLALYAQMGQ